MGKYESVFAPSLPLGNNARFAEGGNAVCQRRMGAKKRPERAAPKKGLYDAQGRSRRRYSRRRNAIVVPTQLLKGADQSVRVSHHPCAGLVGGILPLAGESELQEHGGKRGQNHHQQTEQSAASASLAIIAVRSPVGNPGDGASNGCSDRTDENVVVAGARMRYMAAQRLVTLFLKSNVTAGRTGCGARGGPQGFCYGEKPAP